MRDVSFHSVSCLFLQEFFQGLECHMILTQTLYSKVSGLVVQRESQALEETMALAQSVTKVAHGRGVELEGILEVWKADIENQRNSVLFLPLLINQFFPAVMEQVCGGIPGSLQTA